MIAVKMGRMTPEEARRVLGIGPYATLRDVRSAYKRLALIHHPDKIENSPETIANFQKISAAYKRLSSDEDNDEMNIDQDYTFQLFRKMFQAERQVIRINTEHGSFLVLGPCYKTRKYSVSSDEEFDASHYSFKKQDELINEETSAKKKADKKRIKKQRQRENRRQAKEDIQKQREDSKLVRKKVNELTRKPVQQDNKKEMENINSTNGKTKARKSGTQNNENQQQNSDKPLLRARQKYIANIAQKYPKKSQTNSNSKTIEESETSEDEPEKEDADIDVNCAFFAKTVKIAQKKSSPTVKNKLQSNVAAEETKTEKKAQMTIENREIKPNVENKTVSPPPNYQQIAVEGNKKASEGKFKEAIALFSEAISLNSSDHRIFGNRSFCFDKLSQFGKALHDAEKAVRLSPKWSKGHFRKGRALFGLKKYADAEVAYEEVLKLDKNCHDAETELYYVRVKRLQDMGFSKEQSVLAIRKYTNVDEALENVLSGAIPDPAVAEVYISDEEDEIYEETQSTTNKPKQQISPIDREEAKSSLWIGNVTNSITESLLYRHFTQYGPILNIMINKNKLYAFVNFINSDSANLAMNDQQRVQMSGTTLIVEYPGKKFVPNRMQEAKNRAVISKNIQGQSSTAHSNNENVKECYFWRNNGCLNGPKCRFLHVPENQGIDSCRNL